MLSRKIRGWVGIVAGIFLLSTTVCAADPDIDTYTYNYWGKGVLSPAGYTASDVFTASAAGTNDFNEPSDIFITDEGLIYVVDTGNDRIVVLNPDGSLKKIYSDFMLGGESSPLYKPFGIFVSKSGEMLITDSQNRRIIRSDALGNILQEFKAPNEGDIDFTGIDFDPRKVLQDKNGYVYVLCSGIPQGALVYAPDGKFSGYFGSNRVEITVELIGDMIWRRFMTDEQRKKMKKYIPLEYHNFCISDDGFIFTCTEVSWNAESQIRKLNPKGVDVLPETTALLAKYRNKYGDLYKRLANGAMQESRLTDITVDSKGFISALDYYQGRIFQYDSQSNLMFAFGGLGEQTGFFRKPVAIDTYDDKLYVLDENKNNITVFEKTYYGKLLHSAVMMYNSDDFMKSEELWNEVLMRNSNMALANIAIGKIYFEKEDYKAALTHFKNGQDRDNYGTVFKIYRQQMIRRFVFPGIGVIAGLGILASAFVRLKKGARKKRAAAGVKK